jgi:Flp pilus assembly protein TadG
MNPNDAERSRSEPSRLVECRRPRCRAGDGVLGRLKETLRREDGQALVELALGLPILLIVVLAIFDFGHAVEYWNSENSLANIAARYAAVGTLPTYGPCSDSADETSLTTYIQCEASKTYQISDASSGSPGLQPPATSGGSPVNVCVNVPTNSTGQPVTVDVYGQYDWFPMPKVLGGSSQLAPLTLIGSATMRIENSSGVPSGWITSTASTGCSTSNP